MTVISIALETYNGARFLREQLGRGPVTAGVRSRRQATTHFIDRYVFAVEWGGTKIDVVGRC